MSLKDALNESLRSGLLFGVHEEPLDAYGRRIVRVIVDAIEREANARTEVERTSPKVEPGTVKAALIWGMHKGVVEAGGFERTEISGAFDLNTVAEYLTGKLACMPPPVEAFYCAGDGCKTQCPGCEWADEAKEETLPSPRGT